MNLINKQCDRQQPACENCIKRGASDSCIYAEAPEDQKTRALRTRLEDLEAQVREITSSLAEATPSTDDVDTDTEPLEQFAKLRISTKDRAVYYGPNSRFAIVSDLHEIFKPKKKNRPGCELFKSIDTLLADEHFNTHFPFSSFRSPQSFAVFLPDRDLCDLLLTRYFTCCNRLFEILDENVYWEQYPLLWSSNPSTSFLAITFFMIAIAARSLNEGDLLLPRVSSEGIPGALKSSNRWKKYGQVILSENDILQRSSLGNIQSMLLLCLLEDGHHVRWNLLGLLGNMARIAGLHRDPRVFQELEEPERNLRRLFHSRYILI